MDARHEFHGDGDAPELGGEDEERHEEHEDERHHEEVQAKALAQRVGDSVFADRGESSGHLDEQRDAHRAEHDHPGELIAIVGARLRGGGDRADLEKAADTRDNAERDA